jgi:hypothetical protein
VKNALEARTTHAMGEESVWGQEQEMDLANAHVMMAMKVKCVKSVQKDTTEMNMKIRHA